MPARGARTFGRRLSTGFAALAAAVMTVMSLGPVPAAAEPSVAEIEAQINEAWQRLEPLVEQYNKVHSALLKNQQRSALLSKRIQPLELRMSLALSRVGGLAAQYYKDGRIASIGALLASGDPGKLADQLALLDQVARSERRQIASVTRARDVYDAERRKIDALVAEQKKQDADLAKRKKIIDAEMARLQQLRIQAYGGSTAGGSLRIGPCPAVYIGGAAGIAVKTACSQIGKPYGWGDAGPDSFDCSGLTQYAWARAGVRLSHYTGDQWYEGTPISSANARPGDLVFFYSDLHHVGLYVGNGLMVHAPRTGDVVRMQRVSVMPLRGYRRPG